MELFNNPFESMKSLIDLILILSLVVSIIIVMRSGIRGFFDGLNGDGVSSHQNNHSDSTPSYRPCDSTPSYRPSEWARTSPLENRPYTNSSIGGSSRGPQ